MIFSSSLLLRMHEISVKSIRMLFGMMIYRSSYIEDKEFDDSCGFVDFY